MRKRVCLSFSYSYEIRKACKKEAFEPSHEQIDLLAGILSLNKNDDSIKESIKNEELLENLSEDQINKLLELNFSKFGSLSLKAMKKIIPYLENGERYDIAAKNAGYNHSSFECEKMEYLKGEKINKLLEDITSPVVKRAVNQTLNVLNAIIKRYGSPELINIELAREMSKNHKAREDIEKKQEERRISNEKNISQIRENFPTLFGARMPSSHDALKYKLYLEQNGQSIYSGRPIDINKIFSNNYVQVDHAIAYSRCFNDSYNNKVLVLTEENQEKGNKIPREYLSDSDWEVFLARCQAVYSNNKNKLQTLTKLKWTREDSEDFTERNLNDTKYMSRFLLNLFQNYLKFDENTKFPKKAVRAVNGNITAFLRKCWGINKDRADGSIHHCIDASVIATVSDSLIQKITKFSQTKEVYYNYKSKVYVNYSTGEIIDVSSLGKYMEELGNEKFEDFKSRLPMPYDNFKKELEIRSKLNYENLSFSEEQLLELQKMGYEESEIKSIKPVFISIMQARKKTGAMHEAKILSAKHWDDEKILIGKVDLTKLKLEKIEEENPFKEDKNPNYRIANYFRPQSDKLVYLGLKKRLIEFGGMAKEAFEKPFYKPKANGEDGHLVSKVKIISSPSSFVKLDKVKGAAANDRMARIDVYEKKGKNFFVPIYRNDIYNNITPNRYVVGGGKPWGLIDKTFKFQLSLSQNDLIFIKSKKGFKFEKVKDTAKAEKENPKPLNDLFCYYIGASISTASISIKTHDSNLKASSVGIQNLGKIEKYNVDILGNIYKI